MEFVVKLTSQILTFEHEGNWGKALEYYDLEVRTKGVDKSQQNSSIENCGASGAALELMQRNPYKGVIRCLQQVGCAHILDLYCQGLVSRKGELQQDLEFVELQVCLIMDIYLMSFENTSLTVKPTCILVYP